MLKPEIVNSLLHNEKGQGMVEYALILTFIALVIVAVMSAMGITLNSFFTAVSTGL